MKAGIEHLICLFWREELPRMSQKVCDPNFFISILLLAYESLDLLNFMGFYSFSDMISVGECADSQPQSIAFQSI